MTHSIILTLFLFVTSYSSTVLATTLRHSSHKMVLSKCELSPSFWVLGIILALLSRPVTMIVMVLYFDNNDYVMTNDSIRDKFVDNNDPTHA
jgi:hypothetical protein